LDLGLERSILSECLPIVNLVLFLLYNLLAADAFSNRSPFAVLGPLATLEQPAAVEFGCLAPVQFLIEFASQQLLDCFRARGEPPTASA
jgi:hypothetical protein